MGYSSDDQDMGHQHISYDPLNIPVPPQIERWWVGGAVLGPSEYKAQYRPRRPNVWNIERFPVDNKYLSPNLLQPHTLAHFSGAGYAKKARNESTSIFPSWKDVWISETKRNFSKISRGEKDDFTFSYGLNMQPKSWNFARQDTWVCPSYIRKATMMDDKVYEFEEEFRIVPASVTVRPLQTEFQGAYKGAQPRQPSSLPIIVPRSQQYETLLVPDMYETSAATIGSKLPLVL